MKKIDDNKIINNEELKLKEDKGIAITCDCCEDEELGEGEEDHHQPKTRYNVFLNEKLLIVIGLSLTIPLVLLQIFSDSYVTNLLRLVFATTVQILLGRPFYIRFIRAIIHKKGFTTDTLVVLSTTVAYIYSLINVTSGSHVQFFEASSSVLTIFTIGEYLESRVLKTTSESLRNLLALKPKSAVVIRNGGKEEVIDADNIVVGDTVVTKPGEKIATDGIILHGKSSVDESIITGESIPVDKKIGDRIIGGSINKNGYLQFKATTVGSHTVLASIIELVKRAKMSKAPVQRIADRALRYFIPIILSIAIASSLYWFFVAHQPISFAVTVFATILVVSCPCALGIATPMVISLGIDKAARQGVLIKGGQYLEKLSSIDTIVFDKTGTLTNGKPEVTDVIPNKGYTDFELLQLAASAEIKSEHPIAQAITRKATEKSIPTLKVSEFNSLTGHGVVASYFEKTIFVGNLRKNDNGTAISQNSLLRIADLESEGKTVVAVFIEDKLAGLIAVADTLRDNAEHVIAEIQHNMKKNDIILMTGDNQRTANTIAKKLGIQKVLSQVLPESKTLEIKKLQDQGKKVVMVGDGINDAPALTQADIGIAIGSGTDVALSSGHIILMKSDLLQILYALKIGQYSMKKIKQNLSMSFVYNVVTISIAAGLLYGITNSLVLTPALAALGWVISDSAVFGNSLLVRKFSALSLKNR
ncbi:MAG TPA: copper-translocating P-type ATPase [Nitrososphaeraceae archaeon]